MNTAERFDRLDSLLAEGRIVRRVWSACLLAAIAPEVTREQDVALCPPEALPLWMAHLTPLLEGASSDDAWPAMVRRYAVVVRRGMMTLDAAGWCRAKARFLLAVLKAAASYDVTGNCGRVAKLWTRALAGVAPTAEEWEAAQEVAEHDATLAYWDAQAARALIENANYQLRTAEEVAAPWGTLETAVRAAECAAEAWEDAEAATTAARCAVEAPAPAAWRGAGDWLAVALFDAIDSEAVP
jgi:hypothetical protein